MQEFLAGFLEKGYVSRADPVRGRFRTFLLSAMQNFLHNVQDRSAARKRGGGRRALSWDARLVEARYQAQVADGLSPEKAYDKRWATTMLEGVLHRLREDFKMTGRAELFERLKGHLWIQEEALPYGQLAEELGMTPMALKVTVHRLRQRFGQRLREEIAHTFSTAAEVEEEIQYLFSLFGE